MRFARGALARSRSMTSPTLGSQGRTISDRGTMVASNQPAAEPSMSSRQATGRPAAGKLPTTEPSAWGIALGSVLAGCLLSAAVERRAVRTLARERRRVAADVHDLVMQDLSLALANARTLAHEHAQTPRANLVVTRADLVVTAGERALAGARVVVSGLTDGPARASEPIVRAI